MTACASNSTIVGVRATWRTSASKCFSFSVRMRVPNSPSRAPLVFLESMTVSLPSMETAKPRASFSRRYVSPTFFVRARSVNFKSWAYPAAVLGANASASLVRVGVANRMR